MKTPTLLVVLTLLFAVNKPVSAQLKPECSITGSVIDSVTKKPLNYITIGLKTEQNEPVKSVLSKDDGSFILSGLKPVKYKLTVVAIGLGTKNMSIDMTDSTGRELNLGAIYLSAVSNQLKEVSITADKPMITQEIDRISYNLQADPESKSSNVLEMMRKVPLLSVDAEDNIQLKGDKNYKILINGKPSSMVERNPKDILRSMPASSIEKIEVITTPPAKYDADGLAGIINIITNKKVDNGYNGNLNLNERFPVGGPGIGGSFTVKQGKFGTSGYGGGSLYNTPSTLNTNSRFSSATALTQSSARESDSRSGYFGAELSYEIDTLNLISGQFNINGNRNQGNSSQYSLLTDNSEVKQSYRLANANTNRGRGLDAALNYQLGFKSDKNRLLTLSYRFFTYTTKQFNSLQVNDPLFYSQPDYQQKNKGESSEQTFQIDYVHPVKKLTIETGIKGILRDNQSVFSYDSLNNKGLFVPDADRSNRFDNRQTVLGAYNSYHYNLKDWGFKGGVRLEQTIIDADFATSQFQKDFLNLIPSLSISKKLKNMSSITLGFSRKIKRPGIHQLNPFVDRSNPNFQSSGNPNLRPASASGIDLRYSKFKKGSFNAGLSYQFYNKLIMPISTLDTETNITHSSFGNTGKARVLGANLNINYPLSKKWNMSINGQAGYGQVTALVNNQTVENEGLMYYINGSTGYRFEKGWRINANLNMHGPNLSLQGTSNTFLGSSFSVNKDIIKDKLSFSAAANNPFSKYRYYIRETNGQNFTQESSDQSYLRSFTTSVNYRFGKLKSSLKKSKKGIINDDTGGGMGGK